MHRERVPDNPICPLCEQEVLPGDHVVFAHTDIVHLTCRLENDSVADAVADLLRRNAGAEYCQSCLARVLHTTYEQIAKAVTALRMTSRYRVTAMATCSVCANYWMTVRAEPPSID
jgi:hypothetical protein